MGTRDNTCRHLSLMSCVSLDNPLVARHLAYCEHNLGRSLETIKQKRVALRQLCKFLAELYGGSPDDPTVLELADLPELLAWQQWMTRSGLTAATRAYYTSAARKFYEWAASRASGRIIPDNPAAELPVPSYTKGDPNPINDDDLYLALDCAAASDARAYAWLMLGCAVGLRCCEIAQMDSSKVTWDDGAERVMVGPLVRKGGKICSLPGGSGVYEALLPFRYKSGPWFIRRHRWSGRDLQITGYLVSRYLARYLGGLGITATAHQLRHWFGTTSYALRKDLRATQDAMGHGSPVYTARYVRVVDGDGKGISLDVDEVVRTRGGRKPNKSGSASKKKAAAS